MRVAFTWIGALAVFFAACSSQNDTSTSSGSYTGGVGGSRSTGTSTGSTTTGSGCPMNYTDCDTLCCAPGKICSSAGHCDYPYETADLYVYLCPSFNSGTCKATYFSIDQSCTPLHDPQPGTCYNTGFKVAGGQTYGISSCTGCGMGCGNPSSLQTPPGFTKPNYYSGMYFYCGTPCTPPPDCSQAANAGGPTTTTGTGTGTTTGAGGAGTTGTGSGTTTTGGTGTGGGPICNAPGSTKQCSQWVNCSSCSWQSCSCFDGSNTQTGYHTSDGADFPCDNGTNCTAAAQATIAHCGCAP